MPADVESYLESFSPDQRAILVRVMQAIRSQVPDPVEKIRYGMPAAIVARRAPSGGGPGR